MKKKFSQLFILIIISGVFLQCDMITSLCDKNFDFAQEQYEGWLSVHSDVTQHPFDTNELGQWNTIQRNGWKSGFFVGSLWRLYEYTHDKKWRDLAVEWTSDFDSGKNNVWDHDMGFRLLCSYGNGYRLIQNDEYRHVILVAANSLTKRFDDQIGMIKSWDNTKWEYPTSIENMMNLELLFWASKQGGPKQFYDIAVTHANNTIKHHIRDDGSTYQVVNFNPDGTVKWRGTRHGFSDESTWAKGQAFGIYGFMVAYRETQNEKYLNTAKKLADYFINNLPDDCIPYSDFNSPKIPNCEKDASAAAIASCALQNLDKYFPDMGYKKCALHMLTSLSSGSYSARGTNYDSILRRSSCFHDDREKGLIYADYYFLESLLLLATQNDINNNHF